MTSLSDCCCGGMPGRQGPGMDLDTVLGGLYELIAPHLTEKQRRLLAGAAVRALGRGGGARMARISGLSRPTVYAGVRELDDPPEPRGRVRRPGGGPKRVVECQPGLLDALDELVDPDTRGDPDSPLRWTCKSTRQLADALAAQGFQVSDGTVGRLLTQQRYTLQRTRKTEEGAQHPDRDAQFRYINQQAKQHLADGQPVVSGHQEEGAGRPLRQRRAGVAARGRARAGAGPRLPRHAARQGDPLRGLRLGRQRRLGERRG